MSKLFYTYCFILLISMTLLLIGTLLPQRLIDANLISSIPVFEEERSYPYTNDYEESSKLDNFTDALILEEAGAMTSITAIFSNPTYFHGTPELLKKANNFLTKNLPDVKNSLKRILKAKGGYLVPNNLDPVTAFPNFALNRASLKPTGYYVRYWQGFRTPVRFLLCFFDYQQIVF